MKTLPLLFALLLSGLAAMPAGAVAPGESAPAFALLDVRGNLVALERLRGKVVYVDFWASWCGPCRQSFPWMNALQQRYPDRLVIVGVNVDRRRADADRFLQEHPAQFTVVFDAAGATPTAWAVKGMPTSFLVDAGGKVVAVETGFEDAKASAMEERIRGLIAQ
jgi:thiol-disulfide isomerase/thioredoxin